MRERAILTAVWLAAFAASLVLLELYVGRKNAAGLVALLPGDRLEVLKPISILYGSYLAGVLAFWFVKPFKGASGERARRIRFAIALACTLIFNAVVLYLLAREHFSPGGNVIEDVESAVKAAKLLSFIVAPVNLYYFGVRAGDTHSTAG